MVVMKLRTCLEDKGATLPEWNARCIVTGTNGNPSSPAGTARRFRGEYVPPSTPETPQPNINYLGINALCLSNLDCLK